jgi:hypothetical protein
MWWSLWWVWLVAAILLAILEVVAPAQIFLGFAIGAAGVGLALLLGIPGPAARPRQCCCSSPSSRWWRGSSSAAPWGCAKDR